MNEKETVDLATVVGRRPTETHRRLIHSIDLVPHLPRKPRFLPSRRRIVRGGSGDYATCV